MKPKEYIEKYKLNEQKYFSHSDFINDMIVDFLSLLEITKDKNGKVNIKGYENTIKAIRDKWDAINRKTGNKLPDKLWNYFYASFLAKHRDEWFPDEMKRRKEKKQRWEEYKKWEDHTHERLFSDFFERIRQSIIKSILVPKTSFEVLGLPNNCSREDVEKAYRELSKIHHPDKGGNHAKFIEITEAKNRCLFFLEKEI